MTPNEMQLLYIFNDWANKRAMQAASALTPEQFTKPLGNSFSSVRDTLAHICGGEWVWLQRFKGSSPSAMPDNLSVRRYCRSSSPLGTRRRRSPELRQRPHAARPRSRH